MWSDSFLAWYLLNYTLEWNFQCSVFFFWVRNCFSEPFWKYVEIFNYFRYVFVSPKISTKFFLIVKIWIIGIWHTLMKFDYCPGIKSSNSQISFLICLNYFIIFKWCFFIFFKKNSSYHYTILSSLYDIGWYISAISLYIQLFVSFL